MEARLKLLEVENLNMRAIGIGHWDYVRKEIKF